MDEALVVGGHDHFHDKKVASCPTGPTDTPRVWATSSHTCWTLGVGRLSLYLRTLRINDPMAQPLPFCSSSSCCATQRCLPIGGCCVVVNLILVVDHILGLV